MGVGELTIQRKGRKGLLEIKDLDGKHANRTASVPCVGEPDLYWPRDCNRSLKRRGTADSRGAVASNGKHGLRQRPLRRRNRAASHGARQKLNEPATHSTATIHNTPISSPPTHLNVEAPPIADPTLRTLLTKALLPVCTENTGMVSAPAAVALVTEDAPA